MTTIVRSDPFWINDLEILYKTERLTEFFPTKDMTLEERLNSLMRFGLYVSILLFLHHREGQYIYIAITIALFTYLLYENRDKTTTSVANIPQDMPVEIEELENKGKKECTRPTLDNPFMNYTMGDRLDHKDGVLKEKFDACDMNKATVKEEADKYFRNNLFNDVSEVFGKLNSQRQYFSMPWSGAAPDLDGKFKDWLYKRPTTFKERADQLNNYVPHFEDIRHNRMPFAVYEQEN